jgi:hypothetical protein
VLLNLCAFASLVAGRLVFPLFTTVLLSFIHPTSCYQKHKKREERNNKGKSKGTVHNHKKNSKRRKVKEGNQKLARPISLPSFVFG